MTESTEKYQELNKLLRKYLKGTTNMEIEEIQLLAEQYYDNGEIDAQEYDTFIERIEELAEEDF